jgi:flagellar protein FlaI
MHADDVETAVKRLTQPPMNIPASIITLMNCVIAVRHVRTPVFLESGRRLSSRKFVQVSEIRDASSTVDVFDWNASSDIFQEKLEKSIFFKRIAKRLDISLEQLIDEFEHRKKVLLTMVEHNVRDYRSVNRVLSKYYHNPSALQAESLRNFKW